MAGLRCSARTLGRALIRVPWSRKTDDEEWYPDYEPAQFKSRAVKGCMFESDGGCESWARSRSIRYQKMPSNFYGANAGTARLCLDFFFFFATYGYSFSWEENDVLLMSLDCRVSTFTCLKQGEAIPRLHNPESLRLTGQMGMNAANRPDRMPPIETA